MTAWCYTPTIFKQRRVLRIAGLLSLCVALTTTLLFANVSRATAGINQTLSFQGRLQTNTGSVVPDGHYNIQFKIYQDGTGTTAGNSGGTLKWTENWINNGGTSGVEVKNGYFSVALGSKTAFGTNVDWNQDTLWLSMNVAGSATACTTYGSAPCTADGEMLPMKRITAAPFAINSAQLEGKTASNFVQLAQGVQTDASTNTSSIFLNKTGSGNLVQLQNNATDVFSISSDGDISFGNNAAHTIRSSTSAADTNGQQLNIFAGTGGSGTGSTGGDLVLLGGWAGGTNADGGNIRMDAGAKTGTGFDGYIAIGTTNASGINIGSTYLGLTQSINVGNNNTAGNNTDVVIGNGAASNSGTTIIQSKDDVTIKTNGTTRAAFDNSGNLSLNANTTITGNASTTAPAFAANGTNMTPQSNGATASYPVPAGVAANDIILVFMYANDSVTVSSLPSGFTEASHSPQAAGASGSGQQIRVFWKRATGSDSGTYDFGVSNYDNVSGWATRYTGVITSGNPFDADTGGAAATTTSIPSLSLTTTGSNRLLVWAAFNFAGATTTAPAGFTGQHTSPSWRYMATKTQAAAGSTGSITGTVGSSTSIAAWMGALIPAISGSSLNVSNGTSTGAITRFQDNSTDVFTIADGGAVTVKNETDSASAFTIQNASSNTLFSVDTSSNILTVGNVSNAISQTINIGTNNTASSSTNVTIGSGSSASSGTTAIQSKGSTTISTNGTTRATFDNAGNLALTTVTNIQATSTSAFRVQNGSSQDVFNVDTTNKQVTVTSVSATTLPTLSVTQTNTSDAALSVGNALSSYYLGVDASDGSKFKIANHGPFTNGATSATGAYDSSNQDNLLASLVRATHTGTVTKLRAHVGAATGLMQAALYADNGSQTAPGALIASSSSVAPTPNSWVEFTISSSNVTAGDYYWIATNANSATTAQNFKTGNSILAGRYKTGTTFGTWPNPPSGMSGGGGWAVNMDIVPSALTDQFTDSTMSIDQTGATIFQNTINTSEAFQIRDSGDNSLFNVNTADNFVMIGDGDDSGPQPTLFALDKATSAPTVDASMLGSMYYDTTLGKVQCYEEDGWGACGAAPDTFVTLSPQYANAVMNGADIGTISSDICSDTLNINDGSSAQPTICGTDETFNFYKWTSAEATNQTRSIYVSYQLPSNFKNFIEGETSLMGRTDSSNSSVTYQIYKDNGSGLTSCGSSIAVSTGSQTTWQQAAATGGNELADCGFAGGDSVLFRINLTAKSSANAYVSNLNFVFSND